MKRTVIIMAKEPRLGQVKTRLAAKVGAARARVLAEAFVMDTLAHASAVTEARVLVAHAPADAGPWFQARCPEAVTVAQPTGDLGARMGAAVAAALDLGAKGCVLMGMDTPHLGPATLETAFDSLERADICIDPSEDGGYYLLGLKAPHPALFTNIPWSSPEVYGATSRAAAGAGLRVSTLPEEFDVDTATELDRLDALLKVHPELAPASRRALQGS